MAAEMNSAEIRTAEMDTTEIRNNVEAETVVIDILDNNHENNPALALDGNRIVMELLHLIIKGKKKTIINNFSGLCEKIKRQEWHVLEFLLDVSGFLDRVETTIPFKDDGKNVILEGPLTATDFNETIQLYLNAYVICSVCSSSNTTLFVVVNLFSNFTCLECGHQQTLS